MPKALKQKQEYGIPLSRYTVFLQNCPLGHDPKATGLFLVSVLILIVLIVICILILLVVFILILVLILVLIFVLVLLIVSVLVFHDELLTKST